MKKNLPRVFVLLLTCLCCWLIFQFLTVSQRVAWLWNDNAIKGKRSDSLRKQELCPDPDKFNALSCLRKTTPNISLDYPHDAFAHFHDIHQKLAAWTARPTCYAGYCGPWLEDVWIQKFRGKANSTTCLASHFGPFIPLFIPWNDLLSSNRSQYREFTLYVFEELLRKDVLYVTVSQNDQGVLGTDRVFLNSYPNVLVLSAGGYGHVPIPSLTKEQPTRGRNQSRSYSLSFSGNLNNGPHGVRREMHEYLLRSTGNLSYKYYFGEEWQGLVSDSWFSLAPRGYGRTSLRLMEILQMGFIPVHVYHDIPWVPYPTIFDTIAFKARIDQLPSLLNSLQEIPVSGILRREEMIRNLRSSHFTMSGVFEQIQNFLLGYKCDLTCVPLPSSVR